MRRYRRPAAERLLSLIAALGAALGVSPAQAQTDPFALPTGVTAKAARAEAGPGLSEIAVDGDVRKRFVDLAWEGGVLTIDADNARVAGLPVPDSAKGKIPLATLKIAKWSFDPLTQRLDVQLLRKSDGGNFIDMTAGPRSNGASAPLTAFRIDYDMTATAARGQVTAGGVIQAALVRGNVAATSGFQVISHPGQDLKPIIRLDSQVQLLLPRSGTTATAGDFISAGGQSQRALRLGGFQIASDYSLRPDLVTTALPAFTGQVSVPTGVEVISGDQRYKLGEVQPGEFTVRNVPSALGRGEVAVIVRDSLGREVVQNTRFYASRNLLAPNVREYAVNIGAVRRRYGTRSSDYGPLAANVYYRRGLSSRVTVEGTAEWTPGLINMGARGDVVLRGVAMATLETRFSAEHNTGTTGTLVKLGLESQGRTLSGRISATLPSSGYRDVSSKLGDPLPPREYLAQISYQLRPMTQFSLSAGRQQRRFDPRYASTEPRVDFANAAFRTPLGRGMDVFASLGYRKGLVRSVNAWLGLSMQLGGGRSAQGSVSKSTSAPVSASAGLYRYDSEEHPLGYGLEGQVGGSSRFASNVSYRSTYGRVEGQVEAVNGQFGLRANARGTLLFTGGTVFARNQTGGSYALVRTGKVDGVTVLRENRVAGVTKGKGLLLIENIAPQVPLTFDIDPDKLPSDALARATQRRIEVPRKAVGLVFLDVIRFRPRSVRATDPNGVSLPAGTVLVAMPSGEQTMVGFDGMIDFNVEGTDRRLEQRLDGGMTCVFDMGDVAAAPADQTPQRACRLEMRTEFVTRDPARGKGGARRAGAIGRRR